ncbi:hypothetical protein [Mycolicibacterium neoaurum]|uniref:Uncharacterized protein n=1 Tax=Mycolicibacterium neoaurum TaxID=1795 RepID=A0AAV2WHQ4_MYCNE|nr:hypothetical protein [Mycolicibacterium neoaurum]TLH56804.1 hypothetical protein C1S81_20105 [Mycolicibacterium neoaurum]CDQ43563.1 hypothetical protein BN1047_01434 [Mycolicibacterium neoaurum]
MTDTVTPENTESTADTFIDAEIVPVAESDTGRHAGDVLERQLDAGQDLSTHLIEATTDAAAAVAESPAKVIAAIRSGATLPAALGETNEAVQEAVLMAGSRIRTAVGAFVNQQAPLPNAVIVGAAEVAAATVRGQGELVSSAVDGVFEVAVTVGRRGDVRDVIDQEWSEFNATAVSVREAVEARIAVARRSIRDAVS